MASYTTLEAQFAPGGSLRLLDATVYNQIKADYGLGTGGAGNILFGVSPATLVARYGVGYTDNPSTTDYSNLEPIGQVFTVSSSEASQVLGHVVSSSADGIQTQGSVSYTDPNGVLYTTVTWEWQIEVVLYQTADATSFSSEVVTWTGDGTATRHITTGADLSSGVWAVLIFPQPPSSWGGTLVTSGMLTAGKFATYSCAPASTIGGIIAVDATGFTVKDSLGENVSVNTNTIKYTALVFRDSTGARLAVGTYAGTGVGQVISVGNIGPTLVWVTGRASGFMYAETDHMPAGSAVSFSSTEAKALTGIITAIDPVGTFTIGTDNNVNNGSLTYYWVAMGIGASDTIRNSFDTFKVTGAGGVGAHVTGLAFTPVFALARPYVAGAPVSGWRGPFEAGTTSWSMSSGLSASGSIESFSAGDIGIGATMAPDGTDVYGFALATSGSSPEAAMPTWVLETEVPNPDGTTSTVQTVVQSDTSPGDGFVMYNPGDSGGSVTPTPQWWCNDTFGYSVYQIDSPGSGWVACVGPATDNGWYLSTEGFGAADIIVSGGQPADPRAWVDIVTWATGNTGMLGGSPGAACVTNNQLVYPGTDYTVGTTAPTIRIFNGRSDRELCRVPATSAGVTCKAVLSMLAANGTVYFSTWDSGTTSADWAGRVFSLDATTGTVTLLGTTLGSAGEMPYALAWHMGRLWCGTNNGIGTVGKIYFFRPGVDTSWTLDYSTATSTAGGVDSMCSYAGKLFVGTDNAAASRGKVLVRDSAGAYTTSDTGTGGTAVVNNGYLAMCVFGSNLYASYWNNDTTAISTIRKFDGTSWSTVYSGASGTLRPFIVLASDANVLYAIGGGKLLSAAIVSSANGTVWTDMTSELPETDITLLPMFGAVVF